MSVETGWPAGRWAWVAGFGTAALLVLTTSDMGQHYDVPLGAALALGMARAVALDLTWLRPPISVPVSLLVMALTAAISTPVSPSEPWPWPVTGIFGHCAVLVVIAARGASRRAMAGWWALTQLVGVIAMVLAPDRGSWPGLLTMAVFSAVAVVLGDLLRSRAETRRQLAEQQTISAAERAERARWQERARIARELHDVVAHHLSVLVVRADSAPHRLPDLPAETRDEFSALATEARTSLTEMRRVLRLLREAPTSSNSPDGEHLSAGAAAEVQETEAVLVGPRGEARSGGGVLAAEREGLPGVAGARLEPQPGLAELPQLVERAREAGADIRLDAQQAGLADQAVELTAYRIVQEAITNALRHAPDAAITVAVRQTQDSLIVSVVNGPSPGNDGPSQGSTATGGDARPPADDRGHGPTGDRGHGPTGDRGHGLTDDRGHGLIGMRERAALVDGRLRYGSTPVGGFAVEVTLPREASW